METRLISSPENLAIHPMDAQELSALMSQEGLIANYRPRIGSGSVKLGMSFHRLPGLTFWENIYRNDVVGRLESDDSKVVIVMPVKGYINIQTSSGQVVASPTSGFIGNTSEYNQVDLFCGLHQRLISLPKAELLSSIAAYLGEPIDQPLHFKQNIDLTSGVGRLINSFALIFHEGLVKSSDIKTDTLILSSLNEALISLITMSIPHSLSHLYERSPTKGTTAQLRTAIDFMVANAQRPLTVAEIAEACDLSVASLYNLFRDQKETTPKALLRHIRLKAAREDIMGAVASTTIGQIARKWGFINLGDFAAQYQKAFGELPSHTNQGVRSRRCI